VTADRRGPARLLTLRRLELWALLVALLSVAQLQAEFYLASFGVPGLDDLLGWGNVATIAYDVRHLPTLLVFFLFPLILVLVLLWIFLALAAPPAARTLLGRLLAIMLIAVSVPVAASWPASEIRRAGFRRAANDMTPLVAAIRRFESDMGRPPRELGELTPQYLSTVHEFGVRGCRSLEYAAAADLPWRWSLRLDCPNGMFTLDHFFFLATGDYPASDNVERMGEWAFVWD
jgi:hypothetical protein